MPEPDEFDKALARAIAEVSQRIIDTYHISSEDDVFMAVIDYAREKNAPASACLRIYKSIKLRKGL